MNDSRTFVAKVLGVLWGTPRAQVLHFADIDDEFVVNPSDDLNADDELPEHDLSDPFQCLKFVDEQVRKRHELGIVTDFQVTMTVKSIQRDGSIVMDDIVVRPWKEEASPLNFQNLYSR